MRHLLLIACLVAACGHETRSESVFSLNGDLELMQCGFNGTERVEDPLLAQAEQNILNKVNQFRAQNGLGPLRVHNCLNKLAYYHSYNMARQHNASHTLDGLDVIGRLRQADINFTYGAENIHYWSEGNGAPVYNHAAYPDRSMGFWTTSPGHRAALLNPDVVYIGAGVSKSALNNVGSLYGTLVFVRP